MLSGSHPEFATTQNGQMSWAKKIEKITYEAAQNNDLDVINCSMHRALRAYVIRRQAIGLTPTIGELQKEACSVLEESELQSNYQCKSAINWFKYLVTASTGWLEEFRRKVGIPRSAELADENVRSNNALSIDYTVHNGWRLEKELTDFVNAQRAQGLTPSDEDLQRQARLIIYENDDPWNQTLADNPEHLLMFKRQNGLAPPLEDLSGLSAEQIAINKGLVFRPHSTPAPSNLHWDLEGVAITTSPKNGNDSGSGGWNSPTEQPLQGASVNQPSANSNPVQPLKYFLNDAQCFGRLLRELTRFVKTCMSPNNPNQHVRKVVCFADDAS